MGRTYGERARSRRPDGRRCRSVRVLPPLAVASAVLATMLGAVPVRAGATTAPSPVSVGATVNLSQSAGNQFEGSAAIDPTDPQRMFVLGRDESGNLIGARSSDGGATWSHARMATGVSADRLPPGWGNTSVTFDGFGNLFVTYLSTSTRVYTDFAVSTDGGATFTDQTALAMLTDQPVVAAGHGMVWVSYDLGGMQTARGAAVTGRGQVGPFGPPEQIPGAVGGAFGDLAIGPAGQVAAAYGPRGNGGAVTVSLDPDGLGPLGFTTVTAATTHVAGFTYIPSAPNWGVDSEAHLAWDQSGGSHDGRLSLLYLDSPPSDPSNTVVEVRHSDDGGATWSSPVQVNDDTGNASHFMPGFAVDQSSGVLAATWYDTRSDPTRLSAVYVGAVSTDGGATWSANFPIAAAPSEAIAAPPPAPIRNTNWSDYTGLAFFGGRLLPVWGDNSNATGDNPGGGNPTLGQFGTSFDLCTAVVSVGSAAAAPVVTASPASRALPGVGPFSLAAAASGVPLPTVQWQHSTDGGTTWTDIAGATSSSYSATAALADDGTQFRAVFTNASGTATTTAATLSVAAPPVVTSAPAATSALVGTTYSFTAAASGQPAPAVQWQHSTDGGTTWTDIAGATSSSYSATAALADDGTQFRAVFTNASGTATTTAATLSVTSTTTVSLAAARPSVKSGRTDVLRIVVASPTTGRTKVFGGTVTVTDGGTVVGAGTVSGGKVKVALAVSAGAHHLVAWFSGVGGVLPGRSATLVVSGV